MAMVTIGYCDTPEDLRELASSVIEELTGEKPPEKQFPMLAGPNEFIQLIADAGVWHAIAFAAGGTVVAGATAFSTKFMGKLGEKAADSVWDSRKKLAKAFAGAVTAPFRRLGEIVRKGRETKRAVILALPSNSLRGMGTELTSDDPVDIAWKMRLLGKHGPKAVEAFEKLWKSGLGTIDTNPDGSLKIYVEDDGRVILRKVRHGADRENWIEEVILYQPKTPGVIDDE